MDRVVVGFHFCNFRLKLLLLEMSLEEFYYEFYLVYQYLCLLCSISSVFFRRLLSTMSSRRNR